MVAMKAVGQLLNCEMGDPMALNWRKSTILLTDPSASELREEVQAIGSETILKRLLRMAAVATGIDDFHRQLRKP